MTAARWGSLAAGAARRWWVPLFVVTWLARRCLAVMRREAGL